MSYVDGFVLPVPRRKVEAYRRMARKAGGTLRSDVIADFHRFLAGR